MDLRYLLVLLCFFFSGFAGLLYETAWSREFSFVFGTSNLAVATVLAAYMAGLSLGAMLAARFMHRIRRPVLAYGLLELGIAASALAVPAMIRAVSWLYRPLFASAGILPEEGGLASALFYALASFAILGIPTTLMGATLPMLARHAVRKESQIGRPGGRALRDQHRGRHRRHDRDRLPAAARARAAPDGLGGRRAERAGVRGRGPAGPRRARARVRARAAPRSRRPPARPARCSRSPSSRASPRSCTRTSGSACSSTCSARASTPSRPCSRAS